MERSRQNRWVATKRPQKSESDGDDANVENRHVPVSEKANRKDVSQTKQHRVVDDVQDYGAPERAGYVDRNRGDDPKRQLDWKTS